MRFPWNYWNEFYNLLFMGHVEESPTWKLCLDVPTVLDCSKLKGKVRCAFLLGPSPRGSTQLKKGEGNQMVLYSPWDRKCIHHYSYQVKSSFLLPFSQWDPLQTVLRKNYMPNPIFHNSKMSLHPLSNWAGHKEYKFIGVAKFKHK